jgi:Outer membrane protein beta-barrel domain
MTGQTLRGATFRIAVCVALVSMGAGLAHARQGFYLGVGAAQTSFSGGLDGTHGYKDPSGNPQFIDGKMKDGSGVAAEVGYGFNRHFGIEYLYEDTSHKATSTAANSTSNAEFISQLFAIRLTAPLSKRFEAFLRGGYGLYEADYSTFSKNPTTGQLGKVAFSGTGDAIGAGFELFFQELGIELAYTDHNYSMDRAKPTGQALRLPSKINGDANTLDLMVSLHF